MSRTISTTIGRLVVAALVLSSTTSHFGHAQSSSSESINTPMWSTLPTDLGKLTQRKFAIARHSLDSQPALTNLARDLQRLEFTNDEERKARDVFVEQINRALENCPTCIQVGIGATGGQWLGDRPTPTPSTFKSPDIATCPSEPNCPVKKPLYDTRDGQCKSARDH